MNGTTTIMDAISITISSMTIVFLTLILIALVLGSFKYIFKEKPKAEVKKDTAVNNVANNDIDEEERLVVALAASAMAGNGKINPNLHIKSIKRIK